MFMTSRLLLNSHPEKKQFSLIIIRLLKSSSRRSSENDKKPQGKITVLKRILKPDDGNNVLKWKTAASVIRQLNWENKCLYGPIQTSKTKTRKLVDQIPKTSHIIQHETQIPIIEPIVQHHSTDGKYAQAIGLSSILTFPLENKLNCSTDQINELNQLRKYLDSLKKDSIPSVSSILQKTMPKERMKILDIWKQNMIKQLGEEGFQKYQTALFDNGTSLHNNISSFLSSTPETELVIREENIGHWNSLKKVLPNITEVKLLEEFVTHPFLCYRGVVDCFAKYKDHLVVIEWKTSKKTKMHIKDVFDNPLQVAAYVGALNFDPKFQYLARKGLIVVAYESGDPATLHFMNKVTMQHYWNEWLKRVKEFWEMKSVERKNL